MLVRVAPPASGFFFSPPWTLAGKGREVVFFRLRCLALSSPLLLDFLWRVAG